MIQIESLRKRFGHVEALHGINLRINKGEIFGLLGPNGAGKTTTINLLNSLLKPDSGSIIIKGHDILEQPGEVKKVIGVIPQEIALYDELTARENLIFWGKMQKLGKKQARENANRVLELTGLQKRADEKISKYSGGMKRRVNIGAGLMHEPEILLMDEPTVGIDPQSRNQIYEIIEKLRQEAITIVYTTHYMEEAEKLCDRIAIIDHGKIIAQGNLDELKKLDKSTEAIVFNVSNLDQFNEEDFASLVPRPFIKNHTLTFAIQDADHELPAIMKQLNSFNLDINMIDFRKTNLETLFLNLTGRTLRD